MLAQIRFDKRTHDDEAKVFLVSIVEGGFGECVPDVLAAERGGDLRVNQHQRVGRSLVREKSRVASDRDLESTTVVLLITAGVGPGRGRTPVSTVLAGGSLAGNSLVQRFVQLAIIFRSLIVHHRLAGTTDYDLIGLA